MSPSLKTRRMSEGSKLFGQILLLENNVERSDYHDGTNWDLEALRQDLISLGGSPGGPSSTPPATKFVTTAVAGFSPADTFCGARPGFVFKAGSAGVGYYPDIILETRLMSAMASVTLEPGASQPFAPPAGPPPTPPQPPATPPNAPQQGGASKPFRFQRTAGIDTAGLSQAVLDDRAAPKRGGFGAAFASAAGL